MDNALTVDLVLAGILLLGFILGARRGFVRGVMGLVSVILALVGAALLSAQLTEPVTDYVFPRVQERAVAYLEERAAPRPASASDTADALSDDLSEAVGGLLDTLRRFGVSDETIDGVVESVGQSAVGAAERAAYALVESVVHAALYLALFLLLLLACRLLTLALNELCALPLLWQVNLLGGGALSLIKLVLLLFLLVALAPRFGVTWFTDHAEGTRLLAWFVNNTPASILASLS